MADGRMFRPVFAVVRERVNTLWDGMPYDELQVHGRPVRQPLTAVRRHDGCRSMAGSV
jgi:hypothetical protein